MQRLGRRRAQLLVTTHSTCTHCVTAVCAPPPQCRARLLVLVLLRLPVGVVVVVVVAPGGGAAGRVAAVVPWGVAVPWGAAALAGSGGGRVRLQCTTAAMFLPPLLPRHCQQVQ